MRRHLNAYLILPVLKSTSRSGRTTICASAKSGVHARSSRAHVEPVMPILSDMGIELSAEPEIFEVQNLVK
jgi:hypothetical protein